MAEWDIMYVLLVAIAGLIMLLGLAMLFGKAKPVTAQAAEQPPTSLDGSANPKQEDLFTHIPVSNRARQDVGDALNGMVPTNFDTPSNVDDMVDDDLAIVPNRNPHASQADDFGYGDAFAQPRATIDPAPTQAPLASQPAAKAAVTGSLLDSHLQDQQRRDEHSVLSQAENVIALYLVPRQGALDGAMMLSQFRTYGLRFGEMSLFHRFKNTDGTGPLMFSVLKYIPNSEPQAFDLASLVQDKIEGLAFFLGLPNDFALDGFDVMVHIAEKMARDLNADVYDEDLCKITRQSYEYIRQQVQNHR